MPVTQATPDILFMLFAPILRRDWGDLKTLSLVISKGQVYTVARKCGAVYAREVCLKLDCLERHPLLTARDVDNLRSLTRVTHLTDVRGVNLHFHALPRTCALPAVIIDLVVPFWLIASGS